MQDLTRKEIEEIIRDLKKGIKEEGKQIKYYEKYLKEHPHLLGAKKVAEDAIKRYKEEIEEWVEELAKLD